MKIFLATLCLSFLVLVSVPQRAVSMPAIWGAMPPGTIVPMMSQSEFRICQIRRFFCGRTGMVIVAFAVLCLGILIVNQKMHWAPAILILTGIIIFYNAREVGQFFGKQVFIFGFVDNPMCDCKCSIDMDTIFTDPSAAMAQLQQCAAEVGTGWGQ